MQIDLNCIKKIHFVGIKGVAMTALAIIAKEMGLKVTGSDVEEEFPTDVQLHKQQIKHFIGFAPQHVTAGTNLVIYTGAHQGRSNIEVQSAIQKDIPVLPHGKALGLFMQGKRQISVAGSHGKTTISAMISHVLYKADYDPSFAIGCGEILSLKTPAHYGQGDFFVAEADEYVTDPMHDDTPRFLWQKPECLVVSNIDYDHPDVYRNLAAVQEAFKKFTHRITSTGFAVINLDDLPSTQILKHINCPIVTFGQEKTAQYRCSQIRFQDQISTFQISNKEKKIGDFTLKVPGEHNILNATACAAALLELRIPLSQIISGLASFIGTKRRFELVSDKNGKLLYDDYAHHPAEIRATILAVKRWFPNKRLLVIFQPHTYSRTQALLKEFAQSFTHADVVILTDIYASARETVIPGFDGSLLFSQTLKYQKSCYYAPEKTDVLKWLKHNIQDNDLILTMGAGNIYTWLPEIKQNL